ncbi:MAG: methionyl-tRNA formyltransferase [Actinomycetota bacterium]
MPLDIAFFGTPEPAAVVLGALLRSSHRVLGVVTGPDRPRGRGLKMQPTPVKERALAAGMAVLQPPTLRHGDIRAALAGLGADCFVVCAYGLILPPRVLAIPKLGCVNVHFSLLPRWRGAAPIQWALLEGDATTGVTIMQMDAGLDTGALFAVREEPIADRDTAGALEERLAGVGGELLVRVLEELERGSAEPRPQDGAGATYASKLSSSDARIDWSQSAEAIANRVRAFNPRPGAWTLLGDRRIKIWRATPSAEPSTAPPGTVEAARENALLVSTGTTGLMVEEVQPEGGRRMPGAAFVRGLRAEGELRFS